MEKCTFVTVVPNHQQHVNYHAYHYHQYHRYHPLASSVFKRNSPLMIAKRSHPVHTVLAQAYSSLPREPRCPCQDCIMKRTPTHYSEDSKMLDVQSLYKPSSPQQPIIKRRRLWLSSVPLVDLRMGWGGQKKIPKCSRGTSQRTDISMSLPGTSAECEEAEARFFGTRSPRTISTFFVHTHPKSGICSTTEGMENPRGGPSGKIQRLTSGWDGQSRFPKLDECAHFHYEFVELGPIQVNLYDATQENIKAIPIGEHERGENFSVQVTSSNKVWIVRRTYENFRLLDEQLHRCIYDRKFSLLTELPERITVNEDENKQEVLQTLLAEYLERFSSIAGNLINCGPILNWLELDNRGNHLIVADDSAINTPAVAAAYVTKRYTAQASDEISFEVGDMISVIDMPPPEESIWWRGKKGFEVGFFPCECVEIIGDKVPHSINIPKAPTKPVLRKHGKLISFFRSFILSRPSRRKLKQSGILKERVFGCDLGEHLLNSGNEIPMVLICCAEFIEEHGIVDGIYRLSGVTSNIQKLRIAFDEDRVPNLNDQAILQDIHCVASLLKMYFRELPNPLLTYQLYDRFVFAVQSDENIRLMTMRDVVQQLPPPHYRTLEYLVKHLAKVASHGAETGMTPKNVAIVWAPNLLRSKELEIGSVAALQVVGIQAIVTEFLIRYVDLIFNEKLPTFSSVGGEGTPKKSRPKSLAISTPTKLLSLEEARSRALNVTVQSQPKYIEVGGGPASLPSKYHTIIDLPDRKRGNIKLKKSPSGWKSFFSKGKSQYQKEKSKIVHPAHSPSDSPLNNNQNIFNEVDGSMPNGRNLRSVKSAESLTSTINNINHHSDDAFKTGVAQATGTQSKLHGAVKISPHSHIRSISHDSYFETSPEAENEIRNLTLKSAKKDAEESSACLVMDDFEDVASDINHIHINYDNDFDFISTGTDEGAENEPMDDKASRIETTISNSECLRKSPKKYRWKTTESTSPKSKLSLKEKLKQTFASPSLSRKIYSSSSESSEESSLRGSLKRTPSCAKEKFTPEILQQKLLTEVAPTPENKTFVETKPMSPTHSPKTKQPKWTDVHEKPSASVSEVIKRDDDDVMNMDYSSPLQAESSTDKITVERYGSEKTVIVEVHASQYSEEEEQENPLTSSKMMNVSHTDEKYHSIVMSPISCHSSLQGEYGSSMSGAITGSESDTINLSFGETLEMQQNDHQTTFEQTSETESQFNSTISTPASTTRDNIFEVMDMDISTSSINNFSAEIMSSFHVDDEMVSILYPSPSKSNLPLDFSQGEHDTSQPVDSHPVTMTEHCIKFPDNRSTHIVRSVSNLETCDQHSLSASDIDKSPCSLVEKIDSESSSPSADTSGEGKEVIVFEERKRNAFGYVKLVDEVELEPVGEDSESLLKSPITIADGCENTMDSDDTYKLESPTLVSILEDKLEFQKKEVVVASDSFESENLLHSDDEKITSPALLVHAKDSADSFTGQSPLLSVKDESIEIRMSPSQEVRHLDYSPSEKCSSCSEYLSPLDETKRKFESEIGRDILHERKMKLELEKIQLERRLERLSPNYQDHQDSFHTHSMNRSPRSGSRSPLENCKEEKIPMLINEKLKKNIQAISPSELVGVELRHSKDGGAFEEIKRKSEPVSITGDETAVVVEKKRNSEPHFGSNSHRHFRPEKKTSIKQLMSKFESADDPDASQNIKSKSPLEQPDGGIMFPDSLNLMDPFNLSTSVTSATTSDHKVKESKYIHSDGHFKDSHPNASTSKPDLSPHKETGECKRTEFLDTDPDRLMKKEKLSLRLSAPCELSLPSQVEKEGRKLSETDIGLDKMEKLSAKEAIDYTNCLMSSSTDLNDVARRERIDKYKEERRAQLREKIRSESFRLDKEDKSEFLNKLKQKTISPIKSDDHSFPFKQTLQASDNAFTDNVLTNKNVKPNRVFTEDLKNATNNSQTHPRVHHHSGSDKLNAVDRLNSVHPSGKFSHAERSRASSSSSESEHSFHHESTPFLRTIPGRRSLRTGSESETLDYLCHSAGSLQHRSNLRNSERVKAKERMITKESLPPKPTSLPLQEHWGIPPAEKKEMTGSFSTRQLHSPLKERNPLLQEKPMSTRKISPSSKIHSFPYESQPKNSSAISPPSRIREVAAMFEKESSTHQMDTAGTKVKFTPIGQSAVMSARARFLSQGSDVSTDSDRDNSKRKASQYLSAV